jgi:hypothetical protein
MTGPKKRGNSPEAIDLADVPFLNDAERAESEWLLARDNDPGVPPPSPAIASDYADLENLLRNLPPGSSDERWQDEVLRIASSSAAPRHPWWRRAGAKWTAGGGLVAVAAAILLVLLPRTRPELEVAIRHGGEARGDSGDVVVGDHLIVTVQPCEVCDLRIFRSDGSVVARCPNGPACRAEVTGEYFVDVSLDAPVQYQVVLVVGVTGLLSDGRMDAYIDAARAAHARITFYPPINVH